MIVNSSFSSLPGELVLHFLQFLTPEELARMAVICKLFEEHGRDESLWKVHFKREYPFTELGEGEFWRKRYIDLVQFQINARHLRYSVKEITLNWKIGTTLGVYRDLLYTVTANKTMEIWNLDSRKKMGEDIPLQGETPYHTIQINSKMVWIASKKGIESFDPAMADRQIHFQQTPYYSPFFLTDTVQVTGRGYKIVITGDRTGEVASHDFAVVKSLFIRRNILYALTSSGFVERWDLLSLAALEKVDVNKDERMAPSKILGAGKNGEVAIEYDFSGMVWPVDPYVASWDLQNRVMISEVKSRKYSLRRIIEAGDLLFFICRNGLVEIRELSTLEIKSQIACSHSLCHRVLFNSCYRDGHKLYFPGTWDAGTESTSLEFFDFLPAEEALKNETQIALRQEKERMAHVLDEELDFGRRDNCWDICLDILSGLRLVAMDTLEYLWDRFCDFTEWVSSFFDEAEEDVAAGAAPPLFIPLPNDPPANNDGNY